MDQIEYDRMLPDVSDDEAALEEATDDIAMLLERHDFYAIQNFIVECGLFGDCRGRPIAGWLEEICTDTERKNDYSYPLHAASLAHDYVNYLLELKS